MIWFFLGKHSLDQISLDLFTWSKVSVKFGIWSNALFVTRSKVLIMNFYILSFDGIISHVFTRSKVLLMSFWVIFNFQKRTEGFFHLIESLIKLSIKWQLFRRLIKGIIESFDQVKSLKKLDQVKMKLLIKWKKRLLINWNSA